MAAAAVAARTFLKVFFGGKAAQFKRFMDELVDSLLHRVHFLLRIDEGFGNGIAEKGIALGLECGDFTAIERQTLVLLEHYLKRNARLPYFVHMNGHNHLSSTMHLNTADTYLGERILDFIALHAAERPGQL